MDTGNFVHLIGKNASKYKEAPYGNTFFRHATGRMSDGRVLIDFYGAYIPFSLNPFFWLKLTTRADPSLSTLDFFLKKHIHT